MRYNFVPSNHYHILTVCISAMICVYTTASNNTIHNNINHGIDISPTISPIQTQTVNIESVVNLSVITEFLQKLYTKTSVKVEQLTKTIQKLGRSLWRPQEYYDQSCNFVYTHRYALTLAALTTLYAYCYYKLTAAKHYLASPTSWSAWQQRYTTDKLCSVDPTVLGLNLINDIQMEYTTQANPTDFISPLVQFLAALEAEIAFCQRLSIWHTWIERLRACRLFPRLQCQADELRDRLERLTCIKNIFSHWIAAYNIEHNKKDLPSMLPPHINHIYRS